MMEEHNANDNYRKLFCGGLHVQTTKESLTNYFNSYGTVLDCVVMKDPTTGRSRGFGFLSFENPESVDHAQRDRPHTVDGKQIDTKRAIPKDDPNPENRMVSSKIFVGGMRREVTKQQVEEYFSQYGNVTECIMVTDKATGQSRGFGFVTFDDPDTVDKVIIHRPHVIQNSTADVKKALSKEEMSQLKMKQDAQQQQYYAPQGPPGYGQGGYGYGGGQAQGDWNQAGGEYYDQNQSGEYYDASQSAAAYGGYESGGWAGGATGYPQPQGAAPPSTGGRGRGGGRGFYGGGGRGGGGAGGPFRGGGGGGGGRGRGGSGFRGRGSGAPY